MKSSLLHEQSTARILSDNSCYELDTKQYPTLGNEFFTRLRQKYPLAFRRTVVAFDARKSSETSSPSSVDTKSVWSLWECNRDYDKAVVKEAGGVLIPCSDLSVDERLKRICDSFSSVKVTGSDLVIMLKKFRTALLADRSKFCSSKRSEAVVQSRCSVLHGGTDTTSNTSVCDSVLTNSSYETKPSHELPKDDAILCSGTVDRVPSDCHLKPATDSIAAETDAILTSSNTKCDVIQIQSVIATDPPVNIIHKLQQDGENQSASSDGDTVLLVVTSQTDTNHRSEGSQTAVTVCEVQENNATEAGSEADSCSHVQPFHFAVDQHNFDTASDSYRSVSEHQMITDQKPPLMTKGKTHRRNVKSFRQNDIHHDISSSRPGFSDAVPEAPGSAEPVRRRLRLPWKKKKKSYMPGKETSQWRSNFESWRSASQLSLETCGELDNASNRSIRRTASQSDLDHTDTHSVGWSDSDTDTVASDDPLGGSLNERAARLLVTSSPSDDLSSENHQNSGWRSSLRSSAGKKFSSLQRSAGRRLLRLQKALSVGHASHNPATNDSASQTTRLNELPGKRTRHASDSSNASSLRADNAESVQHFRPIGRVVSHCVVDGTTTIELVRPPCGPYGIYLARDGTDSQNMMYISRLYESLPSHLYAGLLHVGDEVLAVNHVSVIGLSLDVVFNMIAQSSKLVLRLRPSMTSAGHGT